MTSAEPHTLSGAYVVHALSDEERTEFERHLTGCESCATEVGELADTARRLGLAVAAPPPAWLRERVMARIASVRQEPPAVPDDPRSGAGARASGTQPPDEDTGDSRASDAGRAAVDGGASGGEPPMSAGGDVAPPQGAPDRAQDVPRPAGSGGPARVRRLPGLMLAACLAGMTIGGGVAVWQYQLAQEAQEGRHLAERAGEDLMRVLTAPDVRVGSGDLPEGASGTVLVSGSEDRAVFVASGMAEPPPGTVYQLWFADDGAMRPAGLMDPGEGPSGSAVLMEGPVGEADGMGITVEPAGGSPQPTTEPLVEMALPEDPPDGTAGPENGSGDGSAGV